MISLEELRLYGAEYAQNRKLIKNAYWFKKNKGLFSLNGQNFGDYLATIVVSEMAKKHKAEKLEIPKSKKLLSIGSVLHFAKDGDIIWGSGVNGKVDVALHKFNRLDIRAVRGPLTKQFLRKINIDCPDVFGDPALLLPILFPQYKKDKKQNKIIVIPNFNEYNTCKSLVPPSMKLISPLLHWTEVLEEILTSDLVLTSSLHGLILSETFEVDVKLFKPFGGETILKYEDYVEGTGRTMSQAPKSFYDGVDESNGVSFSKLELKYNAEFLLKSFPYELCNSPMKNR